MLYTYGVESLIEVSGEDNEGKAFKVGYFNDIKDRAAGFKNTFLGGETELMVMLYMLEGRCMKLERILEKI